MKKYTTLLFVFLLTMLVATGAFAAVTTNNVLNTIPGTTAQNGFPGHGWTPLTAITIAEGANGDFTPVANGLTIVLGAPTNWRFNPSVTVTTAASGTGGADLTVVSSTVAPDSLSLTITVNITQTNKSTTLTISNLQVEAVNGLIVTVANITRTGGSISQPTGFATGAIVARVQSNGTLPVELTSFSAIAKGNAVELAWKTATEVNNFGFDVEKSVSGTWSKIAFVQGNGTSNAPRNYSYIDANVSGNVSYRLKQIDRDGKFTYSNVVETAVATPAVFALNQNYPNPFNPTTNISFSVPNDGIATLTVYNVLGQQVATLYNGVAVAGRLNVATFGASQLSSGVYFSRLTFNGKQLMSKMLLQK